MHVCDAFTSHQEEIRDTAQLLFYTPTFHQ